VQESTDFGRIALYRPELENGGLCSETFPECITLYGSSQVTKLTVASGVRPLTLSEPLAQASGAAGGALSGSHHGEIFVGFQAVALPGRGTNLPKASATFEVSTQVWRRNSTSARSGIVR
jgi:hypothetical protein